MLIDWTHIHYVSVLAGAVLYILYGGMYYSILLKEKGEFSKNETRGPIKYAVSVVIAFISSFLTAILVQSIWTGSLLTGLGIGFIIGLLISLVYVKNSLFGLMSRKAMFIAIGDHLVIFTLLGGLHGLLN
ncbi:DUF1761 family protein [Bacillus sp. FJAT-42376]|uniref:DUF1761 family protein n=1 Tax=Bacillus sp. FJAT-42376 TaxID=2014076 RepID=UPI000F516B8F|nr:DUF1761 family protein [Bacillus sp. FJAT-42376]AZB42094.1 DUF1761 family protein [Bacillus sp. FJAT-42376]